MHVSVDELKKLVKTVEDLRQITRACYGSVNKLKERVTELEVKIVEVEDDVKKIIIESIDTDIKSIKEEQKHNLEEIKSLTEQIKCLDCEHKDLKESILNKDNLNVKRMNDLEEACDRFKLLSTSTQQATPETCLEKKKEYKCNHCDMLFHEKGSLQSHVKAVHFKEIECKDCDQKFVKSSDLEEHLLTEHKASKKYICHQCNMGFVFKWRMKKHLKDHQITKSRKCYYYNNRMECPFSRVGCKFLHEEAAICKFAGQCTRLKCQYRHL